jgi:hypothetical protein
VASGKDRVRRRFLAVIQPHLEVDEEVVGSAGVQTGWRPWLVQVASGTVTFALSLVGIAIVTGSVAMTIAGTVASIIGGAVAGFSDTHHYLMAVSNRRVFLVEGPMLGRPTLKSADLRSSVTIASVSSGVLWNRLSYCRSGARPVIMHFNRRWSADVRSIIHIMAKCPSDGNPDFPPGDAVILADTEDSTSVTSPQA